jgi:hypothetical protein
LNDRDTGAGGGCESNATAGIIVTTRQRVRAILLLFTPSSWLIVDVREGIGDVDEPEVVVAMLALF